MRGPIPRLLAEMDAFIEREIAPLQAGHMQYFDHRREFVRTDWAGGVAYASGTSR